MQVVAQTTTALSMRESMKFGESCVMGSMGRIYKTIKTLPVAVIYPLGPRQAKFVFSLIAKVQNSYDPHVLRAKKIDPRLVSEKRFGFETEYLQNQNKRSR